MAYVTTSVDIELDDIDTEDLVQEICSRIEMRGNKKLSGKQINALRIEFQELANTLFSLGDAIPMDSLEDKMKYEHLASVWSKYSSSQIYSLLP